MGNLKKISWTAFFFLLSLSAKAQDPGIPDTVHFESAGMALGQSRSIDVVITNDEDIAAMFIGLRFESIGSGFFRFDSAVWINRMEDPSVIGVRGEMFLEGNLFYGPYSIRYGGASIGASPKSLPPGSDAVTRIYFTGIRTGQMKLSGVSLSSGGTLTFVRPGALGSFVPTVLPLTITVFDSSPPPSLTVSSSLERVVVGFMAEFAITSDRPVVVSSVTMRQLSADTTSPTNSPTVHSEDGLHTIAWQSTAQDVGLWRIDAELCDTVGKCSQVSLEVQVVSTPTSLINFDSESISGSVHPSGLGHANLDSSPEPEIIAVGDGLVNSPALQVYSMTSDHKLELVMSFPSTAGDGYVTPQVAFLDDDDIPDLVTSGFLLPFNSGPKWGIHVWSGSGDGLLTHSESGLPAPRPEASALSDFNNDGLLDYLTVGRSEPRGRLYVGNSVGYFNAHSEFSIGDSAFSVGSGDFNGDGFEDIAVGAKSGLVVYLNDQTGHFVFNRKYPHTFRSEDVSTTLSGTDFDNNGILDLVVATPSVGGAQSEVIAYFGNGDGTFVQTIVRTPLGQAVAASVGDFNNDLNLDIAYLNSSKRYLGILLGNGVGEFIDEIRFYIPGLSPTRMDVLVIDLDGDLDIAVAAVGPTAGPFRNNDLLLFLNESESDDLASVGLDVSSLDNGFIAISDPVNRSLGRVSSTIPSGEYFQRNIDGNNLIDDFARIGAVAPGRHVLRITPKPSAPVGSPVTVEYDVDGRHFRLAKNLPMTPAGYTFEIYPYGEAPTVPLNGAFVGLTSPSFFVANTNGFEIEIATDIKFDSILHQDKVTGGDYSLPIELAVSDTMLYYWRVRLDGSAEWGSPQALNVYASSVTSCGDVDNSTKVNIADVLYLVSYMFSGGSAPLNSQSGDLNESGSLDIDDVVYLIEYLFTGGPAPVCP